MTFKDLEEGLAELFGADAGRQEDRALEWQRRRRRAANQKLKAQRADAVLDDRLRRKRNRARAARLLPPPLPPVPRPVLPVVVCCRLCRQPFASAWRFAYEHFPLTHPEAHAAASRAVRSASRRARPALTTLLVVRVRPGALAPVAYYRLVPAKPRGI